MSTVEPLARAGTGAAMLTHGDPSHDRLSAHSSLSGVGPRPPLLSLLHQSYIAHFGPILGSWYNYLEETLTFPFLAHCVAERAISPLQVGDEVEIVGMAPEAECRHEMFVLTRW